METRHFMLAALYGHLFFWFFGTRCNFPRLFCLFGFSGFLGCFGFSRNSCGFLCVLCCLRSFGDFFRFVRALGDPCSRACAFRHPYCALGDLTHRRHNLAAWDHTCRRDARFDKIALSRVDRRIRRTGHY
ncbi:hypothetical protein ASC93_10195 [Massilia sp. Root335]|nr:hypothetical protein ASC93_10195 [Massilia sp. Root335]